MKRILTILLLSFIYTFASSQTTQYLGAPTTIVETRGIHKIDSSFLPPLDTLASAAIGSSATKNGIQYLKAPSGKWITVTDTAMTRMGFFPTPFITNLQWSYDNFWTATTSNSNTVSGVTASVVSNKVQLVGSGNNYAQVYYKTQLSYLEHWLMEDTLVINNTISSTTFGVGIGINASFNNLGWVDLSTGANAGKTNIVTNGTVRATSSGAITFANGDTLVLKMQRQRDTLIFTVSDRATSTSATISYVVANAFVVSSTDVLHKIGNFGVFVKGGTYILTSQRVTNQEPYGVPLLFFGDSKFQGYYVTSINDRVSDKYNLNTMRAVNMGSSGDLISDGLNRIADLIQLRPQQVVLEIYSNNLRASQSLASVITAFQGLKNVIEANGSKVWVVTAPEIGGIQTVMAQFDSAMRQMYPADYIPVFDKLNACGAPCFAADGIHWTSRGNDSAYKALLQSGKVTNSIYTQSAPASTAALSAEVAKTYLNIFAIGGNPSFTGATTSLKIGTTASAAFDILTNSRFVRFNWTNALPRVQFFNTSGSEDFRIHGDSLGNIGMGKGIWNTALPAGGNNVIFGNGASSASIGAGAGGVMVGAFANGGITNQTISTYVFLGFQAGYYENASNKFYLSAGNTQNLLYGRFDLGQLCVNPGTNGTSPLTMTASAQFEVKGTTRGTLLSVMTNTQRDAITSPAEGIMIYSTTDHVYEFFNGTVWKTITTN